MRKTFLVWTGVWFALIAISVLNSQILHIAFLLNVQLFRVTYFLKVIEPAAREDLVSNVVRFKVVKP